MSKTLFSLLIGLTFGVVFFIAGWIFIIICGAYEERRLRWLMDVQAMRDICLARGGKNCKNCICYGKPCEKYKRHFHNTKPMDYDPFKDRILKKEEEN